MSAYCVVTKRLEVLNRFMPPRRPQIIFFSIYRRGREIFENLLRVPKIEDVRNH